MQPTLFDTPTTPAAYPRQRQREAAARHANPDVIAKYRKCLSATVPVGGTFIAADITQAYEDAHGKMSQSDMKGLGGLFADLERSGIIVKTGDVKPRKNGNVACVYRVKMTI